MPPRPTVACAIASVLAGSVLLACTNAPPSIARLRRTLDPEQLRRLEAISAERRQLALLGLVLGAVVALVLTSATGASWCWSVVALLLTQRLVYTLSPKSDWLLLHLDGAAQRAAWLDVYADMRMRGHLGAAAALVVYVLAYRAVAARC